MDAGKPPSRLYLWILGIAIVVWLISGVYWFATDRWILGAVFVALAVATVFGLLLLLRQRRR